MSEELSVTVNRLVELTKQIAEGEKRHQDPDPGGEGAQGASSRLDGKIRHRYHQSQEGENQFKALET